ncbi:unnamed protein product, partial [Meganyctiphanes norvegica]
MCQLHDVRRDAVLKAAVWKAALQALTVLLVQKNVGVDAVAAGGLLSGGGGYLKMFEAQRAPPDPCYDESNTVPQKCLPDFVNAAFGRQAVASSTCGSPPSRHCSAIQDDKGGDLDRRCDICDASDDSKAHPASYLTDLNNPSNLTCWQSAPLLAGNGESLIGPKNVTLTLKLSKKYELTYISLQFCGQKPDSLAIFKSMDYGRSWQPFQYYSSQCRKVYGRKTGLAISKSNEQEALCTDQHIDHVGSGSLKTPPTSSRIAFSTLEGRPSSYDFDSSPVLQDWITATDIRIVLERLHPEPDKNQKTDNDATVAVKDDATSYAVADLAIGGRCKCNGHAHRCLEDKETGYLACDCRHNTAGRDCEKCKPFHFDRPWGRATTREAHQCV